MYYQKWKDILKYAHNTNSFWDAFSFSLRGKNNCAFKEKKFDMYFILLLSLHKLNRNLFISCFLRICEVIASIALPRGSMRKCALVWVCTWLLARFGSYLFLVCMVSVLCALCICVSDLSVNVFPELIILLLTQAFCPCHKFWRSQLCFYFPHAHCPA